MRVDSDSLKEGRARYEDARRIIEDLCSDIARWGATKPAAETVARSVRFFVEGCGLSLGEIAEAVAKHPQLAGLSVENHRKAAEALGLSAQEYGKAVAKHP